MSRALRIRIVAIAGLLASGCSTTVRVSLPVSQQKAAELNQITGDHRATVAIAYGPEAPPARRKSVRIRPDTTEWLEQSSPLAPWQPRSVATNDLDTVVVRNMGRGALEGLGWGILAGTATGLVLLFQPQNRGEYGNPIFLYMPAILGGAGAVIGGVVGGAISHRYSIEFCPAR